MKILDLCLKAFGPFTEARVVLSQEESGLVVIYGKNEAGKSSARRGLRGLLFGIPHASPDNFVHTNAQMRIGGRLSLDDGRTLEFLRRKGRKNTLRSFDESEGLDDAVLSPFLVGVSEDVFARSFEINHMDLVLGGESLLSVEGDVGKSIYAAGLGGANLRDVLSTLDTEASELFNPRASKPQINAEITRHKELKKRIKESSIKGRDWEKHDKALKACEEEFAQVEERLKNRRTDLTRSLRVQSALSLLAQRRNVLAEIKDSRPVAQLDTEFDTRRKEAVAERDRAELVLGEASPEKERLEEAISQLDVDSVLLNSREAIEQFREELGSDKSSRKDLPKRMDERARTMESLESDLAAFAPSLSVDQIDELCPPLLRRKQIQGLVEAHAGILGAVKAAKKKCREAEEELNEATGCLAEATPPRDSTDLFRVIKGAQSLGDIDARIAEFASQVLGDERDCENGVAALTLWSGDLDQLGRLPVPSLETIERFQHELGELETSLSRASDGENKHKEDIGAIDSNLDALLRVGLIPTEDTLVNAREERDQGWQLVRKKWIEAVNVTAEVEAFEGEGELPDVYEEKVSIADETADRLRREATRVAEQANLLARKALLERALAEEGEVRESLANDTAALMDQWHETWLPCEIQPLSPREMLAWNRRRDTLLLAASALREKRDAKARLVTSRTKARRELAQSMQALEDRVLDEDGDLSPLLAQAEGLRELLDQEKRVYTAVEERVATAESANKRATGENADAQGALEDWNTKWAAAIQGLRLDEHASPVAGLDALDAIQTIVSKREKSDELNERIVSIQQDISDFESRLTSFVRAHGSNIPIDPVEECVQELGRQLAQASDRENSLKLLKQQLSEQEKRIGKAQGEMHRSKLSLEKLQEQAQCDEAALESEFQVWRDAENRRLRLEDLEKQLVGVGAGIPIDQLEAEADGMDPDTLPGQLDAIEHEISELENVRTTLVEQRKEEELALAQMDGSAVAAESAEDAEQVLARIRHATERYIRVRLAKTILQREIEQYRQTHQAPVLRRASDFFSRITMGSFSGLQSDYDEEDTPELLGVRPDGTKVSVSGMSEGTRDQLFLALRLATIEEYAETSEPMPFVADDILVNFDDERARSTLEILAQLGEKMQVLLFTHHGRIRDQAAGLSENTRLRIVDLADC